MHRTHRPFRVGLSALFCALLHLTGIHAIAQSAPAKATLDTPESFEDVCAFSDARPESDTPTTTRTFLDNRRALASTTLKIVVPSSSLKFRRYDRVKHRLQIPIFQTVAVRDGWAVELDQGATLEFEVTEERAIDLQARWDLGAARVALEVLPRAFARWDEPICSKHKKRVIVHATLVAARFEDEVGQELVAFKTPLGRELELLRSNRIAGYLRGALPVVTVTSLVSIDSKNAKDPGHTAFDGDRGALKLSIERALFGCYIRGLSRNARLQGAIVMMVQPDEKSARVLVDSLHDSEATACATQRLGELPLNQTTPDQETFRYRVTAIFKLQDAGGL